MKDKDKTKVQDGMKEKERKTGTETLLVETNKRR